MAKLPTDAAPSSPAQMAGKPGSITRTSQPASCRAAGSAPAMSASPPVLSSGKISALTCRMRMEAGIFWLEYGSEGLRCWQAVQHVLGDQDHAIVGALKTRSVGHRVFTNHQAFGHRATTVYHHTAQAAAAANRDLGQQHGLVDHAEGVHPHAAEQIGR